MEIVIISGLSGSGKSQAANALEDLGYYTVDNLPAEMMVKFAEFCVSAGGRYNRVALVYDIRAGEPFTGLMDTLTQIRSLGVTPIQWNVDSLDWKELPADEITARVTGKVVPGSIVLFHNAGLHTPEALPAILDWLRANGYKAVPVSELLLTGDTAIDHTGKQYAAR